VAFPRTRAFVRALDLRYSTLAAEVEEDVSDYRTLTPEQNDAVVSGLSRSAMEVLRSRDDFKQAMTERDPPASDYESLIRRLMKRPRK
jgi:hypothetical protein